MDEIFANLSRIQDEISEDPDSFSETNSDMIFALLEDNGNDYNTVINKISKNNRGKRKREYRDGDRRYESESPRAGSSRNPVEIVDTPTEGAVEKLRTIFPDKSFKYLKDKVRKYPGMNTDRLAALILDDPESDEPSTPSTPARKRACQEDSVIMVEDLDSSEVLEDLKDSDANLTLDIAASSSQSLLNGSIDEGTDDVYINLLGLFPHLDPEYLKKEAQKIGGDENNLQAFIDRTVGRGGLPSRKEYELRQKKKQEMEKIKKLKVKDFLREYDDPVEHFNKTDRPVSEQYKDSCKKYIKKKFCFLSQKQIDSKLEENKFNFLPAMKSLNKLPATSKGKRAAPRDRVSEEWDLGFLKEYIFYKLEDKVKEAMAREEQSRQKRIEEARKTGALFECMCCFVDECLLSEVCMCPADHMFCGSCVRRGSEVQIGDNNHSITCFQLDCGKEFELQVLEKVLNTRVYQKLLERRQAQDVSSAGIQNLVQCPFCNYAVIMPESDRLFHCGNPECSKISCRMCKEESHLPLRCDEVEKDDEVKARTKLENAMTEAMVRECPKCKNRFFKTEGCNLMHCPCGTTMCYLCRKEVPDNYKHFYGQGAQPQPGLCPLFSDNKNLHKAEVLKAAKKGKAELKDKLKNDPTKDIAAPPAGYNPNQLHVQGQGFNYDGDFDDDNTDDEDEEDDDDYDDDDDDPEVIEEFQEMDRYGRNPYLNHMVEDHELDWIFEDEFDYDDDYQVMEDEDDYYY